MSKTVTSFVGFDVHQNTVAGAVAAAWRKEPRFVEAVVPQRGALSKAPGRSGTHEALQIVYEADPCGYTLARQLRTRGYACEAASPAKVARRPWDRIKTDRRDALLLARATRAGELMSVVAPTRAMRHSAISRELGRMPCRRT